MSEAEEGEVYFWCRRSCVPWPQDQQVGWESGGSGSSKTARKHPAAEGILGAPELLWMFSEKPVRRTASPTQTVAKESQVDLGSRTTALFWADQKDDCVSQSPCALWPKQATHSAHRCFTVWAEAVMSHIEDGSLLCVKRWIECSRWLCTVGCSSCHPARSSTGDEWVACCTSRH